MKGKGRAVLQVGNSYLLRPNLYLDTQPGDTEPRDTAPGETKPGETEPGEIKPGETEPEEIKPGVTKFGETELRAFVNPGAFKDLGSETKPKIYPESINLNTEVSLQGETSPVSAYNLEASVQMKNSSFILNSCQR